MEHNRNKSNLGEQTSSDESARLGAQEQGSRSPQEQGSRNAQEQGSTGSRPGGEGRADVGTGEHVRARHVNTDQSDRTAGDEGLDSVEHLRQEGGEVIQRGASRASSGNVDTSAEPGSFSGRGAQRGGNMREAEGTGYTGDRSGQLQDDSSLGGSQGRHGKGGSRHGKPGTGTSDAERQGGQTAQNPRTSEKSSKSSNDDIDRSVM